jgi:ketosteroid isomerase-like protein
MGDNHAVSSAKLDLVRSIYAAWERGDFHWIDWAHADIRYANADGPAPTERRGVDGMTKAFRDYISAFEGWGVVADDFLDLGGEGVLVSFHQTGRGKASGIDLTHFNSTGATLFKVSAGKVTEIVQYADRDRALADLGLTLGTGT